VTIRLLELKIASSWHRWLAGSPPKVCGGRQVRTAIAAVQKAVQD